MDDPQIILDGALAHHLNLIRQFKGLNNVQISHLSSYVSSFKCHILEVMYHPSVL